MEPEARWCTRGDHGEELPGAPGGEAAGALGALPAAMPLGLRPRAAGCPPGRGYALSSRDDRNGDAQSATRR